MCKNNIVVFHKTNDAFIFEVIVYRIETLNVIYLKQIDKCPFNLKFMMQ